MFSCVDYDYDKVPVFLVLLFNFIGLLQVFENLFVFVFEFPPCRERGPNQPMGLANGERAT